MRNTRQAYHRRRSPGPGRISRSSYTWINGIVAVGSGRLIEGGVAYDVFEMT
jgi:hypothetical protein